MNDSPSDLPMPLDDAELAALRDALADFERPTPEVRAEHVSRALMALEEDPKIDRADRPRSVRQLAPRRSRLAMQLATAAAVILVVGVGVKVGLESGESSSDDSAEMSTSKAATNDRSNDGSAEAPGDSAAVGAPGSERDGAVATESGGAAQDWATLPSLGEFATRAELRTALLSAPQQSRGSSQDVPTTLASETPPLPTENSVGDGDSTDLAGRRLAECASQIAELAEPRFLAQLDGMPIVVGHRTADPSGSDSTRSEFAVVLLDDCAIESL